ncbi:MAG: ImmA/IrrE family metallo-endopeptidase [Magnetococcales bacterium]|nr:ImmA/IrrE family metallo-endopeptidase [Magnetococcales bacterium]
MTIKNTPERCASRINQVLALTMGEERFPLDVEEIAKWYSHETNPDDPINLIKGGEVDGFDGAIVPSPARKEKGWGIFYNSGESSQGRIRFTLAHEFGHYLLHRDQIPEGTHCFVKSAASVEISPEERIREREADRFAAYFLMPFDDFREQIRPKAHPTMAQISDCTERYGTSLNATIRQWLEYTETRAMMVVSRDGYVISARSSQPAYKSGLFIRTVNQPPVPIPEDSLASNPNAILDPREGMELPPGTWFPGEEGVWEMAVVSDQYDVTISLLQFQNQIADMAEPPPIRPSHFERLISSPSSL